MDLLNLQNLTTDEKLMVLRTTVGLTMLEGLLLNGNSLRKIARMMYIDSRTLYRWKNTYPDILEVVAPYAPVRKAQVEPAVDLSKEAAYRIIRNM